MYVVYGTTLLPLIRAEAVWCESSALRQQIFYLYMHYQYLHVDPVLLGSGPKNLSVNDAPWGGHYNRR